MFRPGLEADSPRLDSQCDRMLARLKLGPATNIELAAFSLKYTSRITDLRQLGHNITCSKGQGGLTVYRLMPKVRTPATQIEMFQ